MSNHIESIMNPQSIAVVGATNRPGAVGQAIFRNLIQGGYQGVLYPVNPKARSIMSIRAYPSLTDTPDEIDLVVIVVPTKAVNSVLVEAGNKGVKAAVVITAGFKEIGGEGVELEKELKETARKYDISVIGPNCLGVINTKQETSMNASFATKMPKQGNIAFISQSGALCTSVLDYAEGRNIGFSKFISFGNKADVNEIDLLRYLQDDPDTDVILMYLEDISDGRKFLETARKIAWESHKPMIAVKSGRSAAGAKAAASHTGSLAGSDNSYNAIFAQAGIQRVDNISELLDNAVAFAQQPLPNGNRIAIITNAGGPGIMATDAAIRHNLEIAQLSEPTKDKLRRDLPPTASVNNPVDVIGDATHQRYESAIRHILLDENVDSAMVILTPQAMTDILETAEIVPHAAKGIKKPVLCSFMGIVDVSEGIKHLEAHGFPNYPYPEDAVRALASMYHYSENMKLPNRRVVNFEVKKTDARTIIDSKLKEHAEYYMGQKEANEILANYGFPLLKSVMVRDHTEIDAVCDEVGLPVAMKIMSPDIIHKFDAGGVMLKIKTKQEAHDAFDQILANAKAFKADARIDGVLMEQMAKKGVEVILGAVKDPKFGPLCMFGLGGTFVEAMQDVTFRLAPMWETSAERMINTIKTYKILQGVRGAAPSDCKAIKECILRLSQLVSENPEINELDINPLIVYPAGEGCVVADSRILLKRIENK
ncbi:acetate--CoA ligase family protein [candidate division KSB1 bacterium]|nr:acetate--CoA ligase family protein [candidate division KSB1 bacterium]